ncbi:MAG: hypothetical protein H8F28_26460 [Fibrella sp.]|nr:hypothetical protein [Armatimonadota bacterium]
MVQADPGVKDETIRTALISIGQSGFHRVGFTDPRLVEIARQVATSPLPKPLAPAQGGTVASARRR